jgi:aminocarboxymuconate-semialdehyde decarboxylase
MHHVEKRLEEMYRVGMDKQILSLSIPGPDPFDPAEGLALAQISNEAIAEVVHTYPQYFAGLASVPLKDPDAAIQELERAIKELGLKGVIMGTNVDGLSVDQPEFFPFYEAVAALDIPLLLHPMTPIGKEAMNVYRLAPMIGFESDICLAVVRLVLSGILAKLPHLKVIVSHLGGAIPYLIERIDNCYRAYPECREHIDVLPSTYLKQLYYDTVSFYQPALLCAYQFTTAQKLILGSDYPHVIGDIERSITSIEQLDIPSTEKEQIFSSNLLHLLKL